MSNQVTSLASGHEGTLRDQANQYIQRLKGGEMGSLPAIGATIALAVIFGFSSPFFFTKLNFTNMFVQAAELTMLSSALVFVILLAEIDLSAGVTAGVSMAVFIVMIKTFAWAWVPALIVGFLTGLVWLGHRFHRGQNRCSVLRGYVGLLPGLPGYAACSARRGWRLPH